MHNGFQNSHINFSNFLVEYLSIFIIIYFYFYNIFLCVCLSIYQYNYISTYLSVYLYIYKSIYLFIFLSIYLYIYIYLSIYFDNFENSHNSFLWPEYFIDFFCKNGFHVRPWHPSCVYFSAQRQYTAVQNCIHLWNNFPCISTLVKTNLWQHVMK